MLIINAQINVYFYIKMQKKQQNDENVKTKKLRNQFQLIKKTNKIKDDFFDYNFKYQPLIFDTHFISPNQLNNISISHINEVFSCVKQQNNSNLKQINKRSLKYLQDQFLCFENQSKEFHQPYIIKAEKDVTAKNLNKLIYTKYKFMKMEHYNINNTYISPFLIRYRLINLNTLQNQSEEQFKQQFYSKNIDSIKQQQIVSPINQKFQTQYFLNQNIYKKKLSAKKQQNPKKSLNYSTDPRIFQEPNKSSLICRICQNLLCKSNKNHNQNQQKHKILIKFDSKFESGNLSRVTIVNSYEYNLLVDHDINTNGFNKWFFFKVIFQQNKNQTPKTIKFNILNLKQKFSLFQKGMKISVYNQQIKIWQRGGFDINYTQNDWIQSRNLIKNKEKLYTLTWKYTFHKDSIIYFSYHFPYTYNTYLNFIKTLSLQNDKLFKKQLIGKTFLNNKIQCITITQNIQNQQKQKFCIILIGRMHPCETISSFVLQLIMKYLLSNQKEAIELRKLFVFKIFPMINPDGVIVGNSQCSISGRDINQICDQNFAIKYIPQITQLKKYIKQIQKQMSIFMICNFHGNSIIKDSLIQAYDNIGNLSSLKKFSWILSKLNNHFNYKNCVFQKKNKNLIFQNNLFHFVECENILNFQISFCGPSQSAYHWSQYQLRQLGKHFSQSILILICLKNNINSSYLNNINILDFKNFSNQKQKKLRVTNIEVVSPIKKFNKDQFNQKIYFSFRNSVFKFDKSRVLKQGQSLNSHNKNKIKNILYKETSYQYQTQNLLGNHNQNNYLDIQIINYIPIVNYYQQKQINKNNLQLQILNNQINSRQIDKLKLIDNLKNQKYRDTFSLEQQQQKSKQKPISLSPVRYYKQVIDNKNTNNIYIQHDKNQSLLTNQFIDQIKINTTPFNNLLPNIDRRKQFDNCEIWSKKKLSRQYFRYNHQRRKFLKSQARNHIFQKIYTQVNHKCRSFLESRKPSCKPITLNDICEKKNNNKKKSKVYGIECHLNNLIKSQDDCKQKNLKENENKMGYYIDMIMKEMQKGRKKYKSQELQRKISNIKYDRLNQRIKNKDKKQEFKKKKYHKEKLLK